MPDINYKAWWAWDLRKTYRVLEKLSFFKECDRFPFQELMEFMRDECPFKE